MTEAEALMKIAESINYLAGVIAGTNFILILFLLFKDMSGKQ